MDFQILNHSDIDKTKYMNRNIISVTHVEAVSQFRAFAADVVGFFGNKSELLTKKSDDTLNALYRSLIEKARAQYPDAKGVCAVNFTLVPFTNEENRTFILGTATGTVFVSNTKTGGKTRKNNRRK